MSLEYELYEPPSTPRMPEDGAQEMVVELLTDLVRSVFQHCDADAVVSNSELSGTLPADEQDRLAELINSAHMQIEVSWE